MDLRVDPLSGRLVAVAPARAKRPGAEGGFQLDPETRDEREKCPFCEGREDQTPPESFALPAGPDPDTPRWKGRVVPNKNPPLQGPGGLVHAPQHPRALAERDAAPAQLVPHAW